MENNKWPELCEQMIAVINSDLKKGKSAQEMMLSLIDQFGGQVIYMPCAKSFKAFVRDQQIFAEFNGRNTKALCRKYKLSEPHIYSILKEQRELRRAKDQTVIDFSSFKKS